MTHAAVTVVDGSLGTAGPADLMIGPGTPPAEQTVATTGAAGSAPLLSGETVDEYRDAVSQGAQVVAETIGRVDQPFTGISPGALAGLIAAIDLDRPLRDVRCALEEVERIYLRHAVYFHHPRYLGHLNCPVAIPALLAETILSAINSSLETWDQSAGGTLIEQHLIEWTAGRLGLGEEADGVFTSGGTQSNLQALLIAREEACVSLPVDPRANRALSPHARLRVFVSEAGHFSNEAAAGLLGLDAGRSIVGVACDEHRRMCPAALRAELDRCRAEDFVPMAVVATAGTTDFGSIDPLSELAEVCADAGVWMHVDAAYGCGLLVSRRRALLNGIEAADSVTVDFHKSFFQPISSSAVLVRDRATLRHVPAAVERIRADGPDELRVLSIFTDVFDCFLRFLSAVLVREGTLDDDGLWATAAECVTDYQRAHPELADRFARHDLFADRFARSCLNRLQLRDTCQMVDLRDPAGSLQFAGTLDNSIARFAAPSPAA